MTGRPPDSLFGCSYRNVAAEDHLRYIGVNVDESARVQMGDGRFSQSMFAADEIMAGSITGKSQLAGFGMSIGAVIEQTVGRESSRNARN